MSLDYNFRISTPHTPHHVLTLVRESLGMKPGPEAPHEEVEGPGLLIAAGPVAQATRQWLESSLGFTPSVDLQFWVEERRRHPALTTLLQGVLDVLRRTPGDAVLVFGGESVLLLRRAGHLFLDSGTGVWTQERLALVDGAYELKVLPPL
ncbi:SitI3 family protein [Myxococcus fulvus]|uniref:SitI3 family protein n=1 Tax=Myxococcus fulvus TaxID=33 RepID=UPI003B9A0184